MFISLLKKIIKNNTPRWFVLFIDIYIVINTFIISYLVRFNFSFSFDTSKLLVQLPLVATMALFSFLVVGSYKGIIRHSGIKDAINVTFASFILMNLLGVVVFLNNNFEILSIATIPRSIVAIHFLLNVIILIASRYLFKELYIIKRDKRSISAGKNQKSPRPITSLVL